MNGLDQIGGQLATFPQAPSPFTDVNISKVENGFIVRVGCKTFVSQTFKEVASGLELYFKSPKDAQEKYCSK